jgi:hypothetical protein
MRGRERIEKERERERERESTLKGGEGSRVGRGLDRML